MSFLNTLVDFFVWIGGELLYLLGYIWLLAISEGIGSALANLLERVGNRVLTFFGASSKFKDDDSWCLLTSFLLLVLGFCIVEFSLRLALDFGVQKLPEPSESP